MPWVGIATYDPAMAVDVSTEDCRAAVTAYRATREILRAPDPLAAQRALIALCRELGAEVVPAADGNRDALPIDVSLGETDPLVPVAIDEGIRERVAHYVVPAVADARLVVERAWSSDRMVEQSTRDPLTGLWNRRSLDLSLDRARPGDALAIVDLDHFKQVNDRLGHAEGDRLLQAFAAHLQDSVRDRDVVGRLGGEEFVILMPSTDLDEARVALERIRAAWPQAAPIPVTFSAGLVNVDHVSEDVRTAGRTALRRADEALYRAKDDGRDRIAWT